MALPIRDFLPVRRLDRGESPVRIRTAAAAFLLLATASAPLRAQAPDDLSSKIVNDPAEPRVNGAKAALREDAAVQGGRALRITVKGKGANVWDAALESPMKKPVKAGDQIVLAFEARLEKGADGATTAAFPFAGVQLTSAPYTPIVMNGFELGPDWKMVEIRGKADRDYPAGALKVSIHLATAKQTVDIGPIVVLDLGP
jgi:hypothetical protein